jgi:predicted esterase
MSLDEPRHCSFTARLDCHYLFTTPEQVDARTLLVVTLHGFGSNPEDMLRLTAALVGEGHVIASVEGPNQFYLPANSEAVGFGWATPRHPQSCVRLHHDMVSHVLNDAGRQCGIPPERRVLIGFSQPVSLNYRFAATCPDAVRGVIGLCGGLPKDWETGSYRPVKASLLHVARDADEHYPRDVTAAYEERLRRRASDVEFHLLEGGHRFPLKAAPIVKRWLERIG